MPGFYASVIRLESITVGRRLELLEAAGCVLLACTVAWDDGAEIRGADGAGFASFQAASRDARVALEALVTPRGKAAPALQVRDEMHVLDRDLGWKPIPSRILLASPCCTADHIV